MALEKLEGVIRFSATQVWRVQTFGIAGGPVNINVAASGTDYFWRSATDLGAAIVSNINATAAVGTAAGITWAMSLDDTSDSATGKWTLSASGGGLTSVSVTFDGTSSTTTTLRDYAGFSPNLSGALSYLAPSHARYLWLPNVGRTARSSPNWSSTTFSMGAEETDYTISVAPSGASKRIGYTRRYVENFEWQFLTGSKVWIGHEATTNESANKFWEDVWSVGKQFTYHPDRSSDTVFWPFVAKDAGRFAPVQAVPNWDGASSKWTLKYDCIKSV